MTAYGCYQLGQIQRAQGRLDAAVRTYRQALEATAVPGQPPLRAAGPAYAGLAEVAYQRDDSTRRSSMSVRASRYAAGSSTRRRWRPGW